MAQYYAPNFSGLLPLFDGKSVAGGKLYAYRAGTSIPAPLFNEDGVELGSWVSIDSNGCADFLLDSALSYKLVVKDALGATAGEWDNVKATNAPGGMENPMENAGDLIVGGTGGTATALPVGSDGQVLKVVSGAPAWSTDATGMENPMTTEGDLSVGTTDGEPARLPVGAAGEVLTSNGTTWAPANIPTQTGDHKVMVDGADGAPGYLLDKLANGDNAHFSKSGNSVVLDTDNDKVAADNTDAAPGFLLDKLYPGNNVTIEPVTDGDVRKVKISASGGGGGADIVISSGFMGWFDTITSLGATSHAHFIQTFFPPFNTLKSVRMAFYSATHIPTDLEVGVYRTNWNGDYLLISKTVAAEQTYSQGVSQEYVFPTPVDISSYKNDGITIVIYGGRVNNTGYLWPGKCGTSSPSNTKICAYKNNSSGGCPSSLSMSGFSTAAGFFMTLTGA